MAGARNESPSATPMADARRRDFTVNGLFYDPVSEQLHDWVGGEADLRARIIRTIGSPEERFAEDHLRLLRAVRFAAQLDFAIEPATFAALKANAPKIKTISAERVRDELLEAVPAAACRARAGACCVRAACSNRCCRKSRPPSRASNRPISIPRAPSSTISA